MFNVGRDLQTAPTNGTLDIDRVRLVTDRLTGITNRRKDRRMKQLTISVLTALSIATLVQQATQVPSALESLANAERAFAKTATDKGIRDSFLEFFDENAIAFNPAPVSATARLRSRPGRPFSEYELRWEPRTGDVAASGELGWLTGPSTFIDHTSATATPQHGNYLSVWRRQSGGPWRVFIDIGSDPPQPVTFAEGFTRFALPSRYAGGETKAAGAATLLDADKALNARIATEGAAKAYSAVATNGSRLHRSGFMPPIGTAAIRAWFDANALAMSASTGAADCADSADLGYSYGTYEVKSPSQQKGAYVRVWQRDASGKWLLVADVVQKS
jgi:ketosteroid isomerase-like protein